MIIFPAVVDHAQGMSDWQQNCTIWQKTLWAGMHLRKALRWIEQSLIIWLRQRSWRANGRKMSSLKQKVWR